MALAAGVVAPPTDPRPDPPPKPAAYELSWTAPPECPTAEAVRERVNALAAEASGGAGVMFVGATVTAVDGGYSLQLRTEHEGRRDERTVEARACDELGESTALVVAISLHPAIAEDPDRGIVESVVESESTEPEPVEASAVAMQAEPEAADDPLPSVVVAPPAPTRRRSRSPQRLALRLAPGFEVGGLPGVGGSSQAALALVWPRLRVELVGAWLWPRRGDSDPPALFQAGIVGARGCGLPGVGRVAFPLCLGVEGGALRADSRNVDPQRDVHGPWFGAVATAGVTVAGDRVGLWSAAELALTPIRTRVLVDDAVSLAARLVSFRLFAGLEIFFSIDSQGAGQRR